MNIVILDGYTNNPGDLSWSAIESLGNLTVYPRTTTSEIISRARDAQVIMTNKVPIKRDLLDIFTRLRFIQVLATGWNAVDVSYAAQLGIPVSNIPGYSTNAVAQQVFAYLLHHFNQVALHNESVHRGDWQKSQDFSYSLQGMEELAGKTIGIIGYGSIGRRVASIARGFGMIVKTSYHPDGRIPHGCNVDPNLASSDIISIQELFATSDIISIHIPQNPSTTGLISHDLLRFAPPHQILINTARGALINEDAVIEALNKPENGPQAYYTDVYSKEPPPENAPLLNHPKVFVSPHRAWSSKQARMRLIQIAASNLQGFIEGKVQNQIN